MADIFEIPYCYWCSKIVILGFIHPVVNLYRRETHTQFSIHNPIFKMLFQFVLHASALYPAIIRYFI